MGANGNRDFIAAQMEDKELFLHKFHQSQFNFRVLRRKYINGSLSSLHRIVITLHNNDDEIMKYMFVQYYFIGKENNIKIKAHGNNFKANPFARTKETTKNKIKQLSVEKKSNKSIYNTLIENSGGLEQVTSPANNARDKKNK